jgi:RNA 2',3'-cyclic 3'-phosphodiesterase
LPVASFQVPASGFRLSVRLAGSMRLFVAVEIDDEARRVAAATAEALRAAIGAGLKVRWVPPENLHLTVRFIGHVEDGRAPAIIEALSSPLDLTPFDIEFGGCGAFPPSGAPRAVWIGLTLGLPGLTSMHDAFNTRLLSFGFEPERRPFRAHLTLARLKDASSGTGRVVREALRHVTPSSARSRVTRATIFQSHLSPTGSRYEPIAAAWLEAES